MPSFIDVGLAVSWPWGFENVDTARTDARTDVWTLTGFTGHLGEIRNLAYVT